MSQSGYEWTCQCCSAHTDLPYRVNGEFLCDACYAWFREFLRRRMFR